MAAVDEIILRRSLCRTCLGEADWCTACEGRGHVETIRGERPDVIAILTPTRDRHAIVFDVRFIVEPAP